jgi:hypothetical protein
MMVSNGNAISALDEFNAIGSACYYGGTGCGCASSRPKAAEAESRMIQICEGMLCILCAAFDSIQVAGVEADRVKDYIHAKSNGYPFTLYFVDKFTGNGVSFEASTER